MLEKVLTSEEYLKENTTYNIISLILTSDTLEYSTDGENYLICRSNPNTPIWIWNKDNISEDIVNKILTKLATMLDGGK